MRASRQLQLRSRLRHYQPPHRSSLSRRGVMALSLSAVLAGLVFAFLLPPPLPASVEAGYLRVDVPVTAIARTGMASETGRVSPGWLELSFPLAVQDVTIGVFGDSLRDIAMTEIDECWDEVDRSIGSYGEVVISWTRDWSLCDEPEENYFALAIPVPQIAHFPGRAYTRLGSLTVASEIPADTDPRSPSDFMPEIEQVLTATPQSDWTVTFQRIGASGVAAGCDPATEYVPTSWVCWTDAGSAIAPPLDPASSQGTFYTYLHSMSVDYEAPWYSALFNIANLIGGTLFGAALALGLDDYWSARSRQRH